MALFSGGIVYVDTPDISPVSQLYDFNGSATLIFRMASMSGISKYLCTAAGNSYSIDLYYIIGTEIFQHIVQNTKQELAPFRAQIPVAFRDSSVLVGVTRLSFITPFIVSGLDAE